MQVLVASGLLELHSEGSQREPSRALSRDRSQAPAPGSCPAASLPRPWCSCSALKGFSDAACQAALAAECANPQALSEVGGSAGPARKGGLGSSICTQGGAAEHVVSITMLSLARVCSCS